MQHGMLKHKGTYEIMSPEDIGLQRADESGLVLGKLRLVSLQFAALIHSFLVK